MKFRRLGLRQRNINCMWSQRPDSVHLKKRCSTNKGQAEYVLGMFLILFLMLFGLFEIQIIRYKSASVYMEDALAAGGLAAALIDIQRYGEDHVIRIKDANESYKIYCRTVLQNIGAESFETQENVPVRFDICGPLTVEKFYIYNVENDNVEIIEVKEDGSISMGYSRLGEAMAPNGQMIKATGIYSELSFKVKGLFDIYSPARKGKLVEVNTGRG